MRPAGLFLYPGTLAGAAPCGEDLTVVVVGGEERQPVSNPLENLERSVDGSRFGAKAKAAFPALPPPDGLQCSAVVGVSSGDLAA